MPPHQDGSVGLEAISVQEVDLILKESSWPISYLRNTHSLTGLLSIGSLPFYLRGMPIGPNFVLGQGKVQFQVRVGVVARTIRTGKSG